MADDLTPSDIRARKFSASRRGYDRSEVADFLGGVADRVASLEAEMSLLTQRLGQLGITNLPDLKREVDDLGAEIQAVLSAAMTAAEGLRTRAQADASELVSAADEVSQTTRGDAWATGTDLLQQADGFAERMIAEAREDALFIRAEAEQDAKRLISDARRQADEMLRSSRDDGERIVVVAKAESEAILEGARQSAEKAQERARALENRRAELLGELEAAETAIRDIEASQSTSAAEPELGVRVVSTAGHEGTRWPEDEGAVRIVPAVELSTLPGERQTVDAEAMAAEVEQMRSAVTMPQPTDTVDIREEPDVDEPVVEVAIVSSPAVAETGSDEVESTDSPVEAVSSEAKETPIVEAELRDQIEAVEEPVSEPAEPSVDDKVTVVTAAAGIGALFAKLRQPPHEAVPAVAEPVAEVVDEDPVVRDHPALAVVPPAAVGGGFDRRDRMLLPIENRGLRGLKRRIVELQNRVLEELRTSEGQWRLGREFVAEMMGDELDAVLEDSFRAGHAAAAESVGAVEPQVTGGPNQGAAEILTVDLHRDVQAVIERDSGGGHRRLSSDVGRVFRGWRTDEAERHVRQAARRAFNDGLLAGYKRLGVDEVEVAAPGRICGECGADTGITWKPGEDLPQGVVIPPAGPSCAAMIVPAGSNGFDSRPRQ